MNGIKSFFKEFNLLDGISLSLLFCTDLIDNFHYSKKPSLSFLGDSWVLKSTVQNNT